MLDDFVVSAHALERFEERFPDLYEGPDHQGSCRVFYEEASCTCGAHEETEDKAAFFIHGECEAAIAAGRTSSVAPLELANNDLTRWNPNKGQIVWTPDKMRGYVLLDTPEGQLVTTVLKGKEQEDARRMLYRGERPSRLKGEPSEA